MGHISDKIVTSFSTCMIGCLILVALEHVCTHTFISFICDFTMYTCSGGYIRQDLYLFLHLYDRLLNIRLEDWHKITMDVCNVKRPGHRCHHTSCAIAYPGTLSTEKQGKSFDHTHTAKGAFIIRAGQMA